MCDQFEHEIARDQKRLHLDWCDFDDEDCSFEHCAQGSDFCAVGDNFLRSICGWNWHVSIIRQIPKSTCPYLLNHVTKTQRMCCHISFKHHGCTYMHHLLLRCLSCVCHRRNAHFTFFGQFKASQAALPPAEKPATEH